MKIRSIRTRKETEAEKKIVKSILKEVEKNKHKKNFGSIGLSPNATELEKFKYSVARDIVMFKQLSGMQQIEMAKILGVNKSRITEILHYRLSKYSLDTLLKYLFAFKGRVTKVDKRIEDISESFDIAS